MVVKSAGKGGGEQAANAERLALDNFLWGRRSGNKPKMTYLARATLTLVTHTTYSHTRGGGRSKLCRGWFDTHPKLAILGSLLLGILRDLPAHAEIGSTAADLGFCGFPFNWLLCKLIIDTSASPEHGQHRAGNASTVRLAVSGRSACYTIGAWKRYPSEASSGRHSLPTEDESDPGLRHLQSKESQMLR